MSRLATFDRALSISTLCLLGIVTFGSLRRESGSSQTLPPQTPAAGTKVALDDIDWRKNDRTVLFVLSSRCHFCENNAEFHRSLASRQRPVVHMTAVFGRGGDSVESARAYLTSILGLLPIPKVTLTPTSVGQWGAVWVTTSRCFSER